MSDTMPESDAFDPDDTGAFPTERERRRAAMAKHRAEVSDQLRTSQIKIIVAVVLAVLGTGAGGLGTSIVTSSQTEARIEERAAALEHRVAGVEAQLDGIGQLQRDVASMRATMETWRSMDASAREASAREVDRRLARIETLLERHR